MWMRCRNTACTTTSPKLVIETVCVMCMIGYILAMMLRGVPSGDMMQTLTTFAAAAWYFYPV